MCMEQQTVRKTFKEKLRPTPEQERALDVVVWRCRDLYNAALEQRIIAYQRRRVSLSRYEQEAELKAIRAEFPEYGAIQSHILQDTLARLDKTYQAFFRRIQRGEKAGLPRFKGRNRYHSFTFKEYGNGAACWSRKACLCAGTRVQAAERACIGTTTRRRTSNGAGSAFGERLGY